MRVVLIGPPASGKGTQAKKLGALWGVPQIATGDMLRAAMSSGSELGTRVASTIRAGELVDDTTVAQLVAERTGEADCAGGFILDGFPRTVVQAKILEKLLADRGTSLDRVVQIDVPREVLAERAVHRRTDKKTGQIYHLKYNPPPADADLEHRDDDREDTVRTRLDAYESMTAALVPYYEAAGLLVKVSGLGDPAQISERIVAAVGKH